MKSVYQIRIEALNAFMLAFSVFICKIARDEKRSGRGLSRGAHNLEAMHSPVDVEHEVSGKYMHIQLLRTLSQYPLHSLFAERTGVSGNVISKTTL